MEVINFSANEKGEIALRVKGNKLYLEQIIKGNAKVGEDPKEPLETKILAELNFYQTKSIDAVIEQLNRVKSNIIILSAC